MLKVFKVSLCGLLMVLLCAVALWRMLPEDTTAPAQNAVQADTGDTESETPDVLFPDLDPTTITDVVITSEERSFRFRCGDTGKLSVNGKKADADVFSTLISQITSLPVTETSAFTPDQASTLQLSITAADEELTATFYVGDDAYARIIYGSQDAPHYGSTDGWRIGTLLLTCDGTRIQNESGQETPVQ